MDDRLNWWLTAPNSKVAGDRLDVPDKRGDLIFRDYGSDILFVAHLDMVASPPKPKWVGARVATVALDDRLGCWALETLVEQGVKADLLFTDCEETGNTTAKEFDPDHSDRYKLILSADRRGTGCVLYQYDSDDDWKEHCDRWLGPVEHGSFSCIRSLEHLGVCGVNAGIGYQRENTKDCWADVRLARVQMKRISELISAGRNKKWEFKPKVYGGYTHTVYGGWSGKFGGKMIEDSRSFEKKKEEGASGSGGDAGAGDFDYTPYHHNRDTEEGYRRYGAYLNEAERREDIPADDGMPVCPQDCPQCVEEICICVIDFVESTIEGVYIPWCTFHDSVCGSDCEAEQALEEAIEAIDEKDILH